MQTHKIHVHTLHTSKYYTEQLQYTHMHTQSAVKNVCMYMYMYRSMIVHTSYHNMAGNNILRVKEMRQLYIAVCGENICRLTIRNVECVLLYTSVKINEE